MLIRTNQLTVVAHLLNMPEFIGISTTGEPIKTKVYLNELQADGFTSETILFSNDEPFYDLKEINFIMRGTAPGMAKLRDLSMSLLTLGVKNVSLFPVQILERSPKAKIFELTPIELGSTYQYELTLNNAAKYPADNYQTEPFWKIVFNLASTNKLITR